MEMKIEDIMFWIIILLIIATALWLLSGSPPDTNAIIAVAVFVAASEILLWKNLFKIDKKTAVGFEKVKSEIQILRKDLNYQLGGINNQLNNIKEYIKK